VCPENGDPGSESLSEGALEHLRQGEEILRLMGLDDQTIESMKGAMVKLYDPSTGDFRLDDFEEFKEVMLPTLLDSPVMEETLASTQLLDEPELKPFWLTAEQLQPCLDEWEAWIDDKTQESEDFDSAGLLLDETREEERQELGQILFSHYEQLATKELERAIYDAIYQIAQLESDGRQKMAKNGMATFTLFPGKSNAFLQYLFVKSIVRNTNVTEELPELAEDESQLEEMLMTFEDSLFSILCEGEESLWEGDEEDGDDGDWDDDDWDDDDWGDDDWDDDAPGGQPKGS